MTRLRFGFLAVAMFFTVAAAADDASLNSAPRSIDVVVTDTRGNHIEGLEQSDFQIFEDGKPREMAHFNALTRAGDGSDAQPRRNILLVFDETSISLGARRTIVTALKDFVQNRVRPFDRVMVVSIVGVGGVMPATSWTARKEELVAALDKVEQSSIGNKSFERMEAERHIDMAISFAQQSSSSGQLMTFDSLMQPGRQYANVMLQEARAAAGAVSDALNFLGSGPGKKIAILAGGGLSTRPGADIFQYLESIRQQAAMGHFGRYLAQGAQRANPLSEASRYEITDIIRSLAQSAHDRGIVIYALDPDTTGSGVLAAERSSATDTAEEFVGVSDRLGGYQMLSGLTGGLTITSRGPTPIATITEDLDKHYLLSYQQSLNAKGFLPKVDVKLSKPGHKVRMAFAGGAETKEAEIQDAVLSSTVAALPGNDLKIELWRDDPIPEGLDRRVKLRVMIPVKSLRLVQEGQEVTGGFSVYVATADEKGNSSAINRQTHDIRWPADQLEQMKDKTIGFGVEVVMKPGSNHISVGVMDRRSQQTGFAKTRI